MLAERGGQPGMTKSISEDLPSRVITAVDGGLSRRAAAERFGVAAASAVRWVREWRESGSTRARPQGGDMRSRRSEEHTSELQSLMRISYAVFCLKNNNRQSNNEEQHYEK